MTTTRKALPADMDEYIAAFSKETQAALKQVRQAVVNAAPKAEEVIKYAMPGFVFHGNLVFFAAFKKHIGFYSVPTGKEEFRKDFARYKTGRGSIQFPLDEPMPLRLITKMVKYRVKQNIAKRKTKKK